MVNTDTDDMSGGKKCLPALEDYYECLHHKKEVCSSDPWVSVYKDGRGARADELMWS